MVLDEPDGRWASVSGGFTAGGQALPMTAALLTSVAAGWPVTSLAPPGVNRLLATSRTLWSLSWYEYDLLVVSASWSLMAVEAVLAERLGVEGKPEFAGLIRQAGAEGLLSPEWSDLLDAGRRLRNSVMHPRTQPVWTLGMAAEVAKASHEIVALLYP